MKFLKNTLFLLVVLILISSCKKDDQEEVIDNTPAFTLKINGIEVEANTLATAYIKTHTTIGEEGQLGFNISNDLENDIKLKMTVVDVDGNGAGMQLCFETCTLAINLGHVETKLFPKGYTSSNAETHILNGQDGTRNFECTIKINQVTDNGSDVDGGKEVFFTYKYEAS